MRGLDRRLLVNLDWTLLVVAVLITLVGISTIFSATRPLMEGEHPDFHLRQGYWLIVALGAMALAVSVDYQWLNRHAYKFYGVGVALLLAVLVAGRTGMGATRWLSVGPFNIQPSEVFRLLMLLALARYLSRTGPVLDARAVARAFGILMAVPLLLVLKQPDLGTAVAILTLFFGVVLAKGVGRRLITLAVLIAAISVPFVGTIAWDGLKPYQKQRITSFLDPGVDPEGVSYHIQQSKVAVGSGRVLGKGYLKGTQGPLRFLPEKHTDFVFAVFAEEWGFAGCLVLLGLYYVLILRGIQTAFKAKDEFGRLLALGLTFSVFFYAFVNIAMTLGMAPVVGIPLPFMSYGGSALVTNFVAIGLLINIRARRFELFY